MTLVSIKYQFLKKNRMVKKIHSNNTLSDTEIVMFLGHYA